ncbi:FxsB family cyclophane-forming radical SAM/SPASM peptide maturase [Streptomyces sp. YIM S03343]
MNAPWPLEELDIPALRASGVAPVPFHQFVLKVHSWCNLACTYCYVYEGADSSWRERPRRVSDRVIKDTAFRIAEHAAVHGLDRLHLNLHGGEPLLAGTARLIAHVEEIRKAVRGRLGQDCVVAASVQTNGTLLTERTVRELAAADIGIGMSLDGGLPRLNNRRVDHAGRSAWSATAAGLRILRRHPEAYAGILAVIDPDTDPIEVYTSLAAFAPPSMDLLLPHAHWGAPPPGRGRHPYADWLIKVFDLWFDTSGPVVPVRLFNEIIGLLLGVSSGAEAVGNSPMVAVVVDTDGSIEQVDSLKSAYAGAPATGRNVAEHSFDEVLDHPGVAARQLGRAALADACLSCPVVDVCAGGNYAHRYRPGEGFRNPSVHCDDLRRLILHIADRVRRAADLTATRDGADAR